MALAGLGRSENPGTINAWLKANGGYVGGDGLNWSVVDKLGGLLHYEGKLSSSVIKSSLDAGKVVICNVRNGGHWVLATGYSGDSISVNDPLFSVSSYTLSEIVPGNNAVYRVTASFREKLLSAKNTARGILANLISLLED